MKIGSFATALLLSAAIAAKTNAVLVETGDLLEGYPVIEKLDTASLTVPGEYKFWFRAAEDAFGGAYHIPVMVKTSGASTTEDGPVLFLQSSLHGDELAGAQVIQNIFRALDPNEMKGTVVGIVNANPNGVLMHSRNMYSTTDGGSWSNLNRLMPGSNSSSDAGERLAYNLWHNLYMPSQPTVFLDLHTQSRGTEYPFFIYADRRNPTVDQLVLDAMPADIIKDDAGESGTVETEMIKVGIPSMTIELGAPKVWDEDQTVRGVQAVRNTMHTMGILNGETDKLGVETFHCNDLTSIRATRGGYTDIYVKLQEDVQEGQLLATQHNAFGDTRATYTAPWSGRVLSVATDPIREPGALVVRLCRYLEPSETEPEKEVMAETPVSKASALRGSLKEENHD